MRSLFYRDFAQRRFFLDCLTFEDGTDRLYLNIGNKLPIHATYNPWKSEDLILPKEFVTWKESERVLSDCKPTALPVTLKMYNVFKQLKNLVTWCVRVVFQMIPVKDKSRIKYVRCSIWKNNEVTIPLLSFLNLLRCSTSDRRVDVWFLRETRSAYGSGFQSWDPSRYIISPPPPKKEKTYKRKIVDPAASPLNDPRRACSDVNAINKSYKVLGACTGCRKIRFAEGVKYIRTPFTRINWDDKPSGYAENPDNWSFLWKCATFAV